ncbi:MAG TPA: MFS transporter, partial [Rhodopila sp.]
MSSASTRLGGQDSVSGLLDRDRIIARPGYNRWLVPPAALAIHLCIGMAYGFSVFWLPLSHAVGGNKALACPADSGILNALFTTSCDWLVSDLNWVFTLFIVV